MALRPTLANTTRNELAWGVDTTADAFLPGLVPTNVGTASTQDLGSSTQAPKLIYLNGGKSLPTGLVNPAFGQTVVEITLAQATALAATPKELVAAPGAGLSNIFLGCQVYLDYGTAAFTETGANDDLRVNYAGSTTALNEAIDQTTFITATADAVLWLVPDTDGKIWTTAADTANKAIQLQNSGDEWGGGTGSSLIVVTQYVVVPTGL